MDFDLDMAEFTHVPIKNELLVQNGEDMQDRQRIKGDAIDFDYHLMWDHLLEGGGEGLAKIIMQDIKHLMPLGMNGFISCQLQRNAFPSSICMTVLAKTMWNNKTDYEKIRTELYAASFGNDAVNELCGYFEFQYIF